MRIILFVVLFVVAAFIGGIAFILFNLDAFVKEAVETVGTELTQTSVTLNETNIDPANGKASLSGLNIANPEGFETDHALALGLVSLKMDPTTVTGDVIVINEIVVDTPSVIYELGENGSNIDAIHENVMSFANKLQSQTSDSSGGETTSSSTETAPSQEASEGPKFIIENVYIRNVSTAVSLSVLGGKKLEAPSVDVHLTDIGKKEGGVLAAEAAIYIMDNLFKDVAASVTNSGAGKLIEEALGGVNLDNVEQQLQEKAGEVLGDDAIKDITKDAEGALKNLFGTGN
ncbi:hypothetical protein [Curvivirga sp.]|uniref:hypothetical protein n=1 Tax=Curvivirga sp. TaxID=2856848 RepID=UPI003B59CA97